MKRKSKTKRYTPPKRKRLNARDRRFAELQTETGRNGQNVEPGAGRLKADRRWV